VDVELEGGRSVVGELVIERVKVRGCLLVLAQEGGSLVRDSQTSLVSFWGLAGANRAEPAKNSVLTAVNRSGRWLTLSAGSRTEREKRASERERGRGRKGVLQDKAGGLHGLGFGLG
jgi:hypothetical protein